MEAKAVALTVWPGEKALNMCLASSDMQDVDRTYAVLGFERHGEGFETCTGAARTSDTVLQSFIGNSVLVEHLECSRAEGRSLVVALLRPALPPKPDDAVKAVHSNKVAVNNSIARMLAQRFAAHGCTGIHTYEAVMRRLAEHVRHDCCCCFASVKFIDVLERSTNQAVEEVLGSNHAPREAALQEVAGDDGALRRLAGHYHSKEYNRVKLLTRDKRVQAALDFMRHSTSCVNGQQAEDDLDAVAPPATSGQRGVTARREAADALLLALYVLCGEQSITKLVNATRRADKLQVPAVGTEAGTGRGAGTRTRIDLSGDSDGGGGGSDGSNQRTSQQQQQQQRRRLPAAAGSGGGGSSAAAKRRSRLVKGPAKFAAASQSKGAAAAEKALLSPAQAAARAALMRAEREAAAAAAAAAAGATAAAVPLTSPVQPVLRLQRTGCSAAAAAAAAGEFAGLGGSSRDLFGASGSSLRGSDQGRSTAAAAAAGDAAAARGPSMRQAAVAASRSSAATAAAANDDDGEFDDTSDSLDDYPDDVSYDDGHNTDINLEADLAAALEAARQLQEEATKKRSRAGRAAGRGKGAKKQQQQQAEEEEQEEEEEEAGAAAGHGPKKRRRAVVKVEGAAAAASAGTGDDFEVIVVSDSD